MTTLEATTITTAFPNELYVAANTKDRDRVQALGHQAITSGELKSRLPSTDSIKSMNVVVLAAGTPRGKGVARKLYDLLSPAMNQSGTVEVWLPPSPHATHSDALDAGLDMSDSHLWLDEHGETD